MKKSILLLSVFLISLSFQSMAHNHPGHKHKHKHNHHVKHHNNFFGGFFAGVLFNEFFGLKNTNVRKMYFKYNPHQDNWRLKKDISNNNFGYYNQKKIVAKFENPGGGEDFLVTLNKRGEWFLKCPKRLKKLFKNKVRKNL